MALFTQNENVKCNCGNDTFTEVEVFRLVKKPIKQQLSSTTVLVKEIIGRKIQCTSCKKLMENPLNK